MEPKSLKEVNQTLKSLYTRGADALKQSNYDYAIELFRTCLKTCPEFADARRDLRNAVYEKTSGGKIGGMTQALVQTKYTLTLMKAPGMLKKEQYADAMDLAEEILSKDPNNASGQKLLIDAALAADMNWIAMEMLEFSLKLNPKNAANAEQLIDLYTNNGLGTKAVDLAQKLCKAYPDNGVYLSLLKNAEAKSAMDRTGWEQQQKVQGTQAAQQEMRDNGPRDEESAEKLVDQYFAQINAGRDNVDIRKKLARSLLKLERYDEAVEVLQKALQMGGGGIDPALQKMVYQAAEARFDHAITAWEEYGRKGVAEKAQAENEIEELQRQKSDFMLEKARERVSLYANDPTVHMDLALILFDRHELDEALAGFQKAQNSPRHRRSALFYKGRCFAQKSQHDIAVREFQAALAENPEAAEKLDIMFEMAGSLSRLNREQESRDLYTLIYQTNVNYKNIRDIVERQYRS